jgi:hypothetical protein
MAKKLSFPHMVLHSDVNGITSEVATMVTFVPPRSFSIDLPKHFNDMPGEWKNPGNFESADAAASHYGELADRYSRWKLSLNGEKCLMLGVMLGPSEFMSDLFCVDSLIGLGIREVTRLPDGSVNLRDGTPMPLVKDIKAILLPDTPEVRAKAETLVSSLGGACDLIAGLRSHSTLDGAAEYLLSISDNWTRPEPVQAELPLETPAAEKPATTVVDDDEL